MKAPVARHARDNPAFGEGELCQYLADRQLHESENMNPVKLVAIALIVVGGLGLAYGGFSYTKDTTVVKLGPIEISAKEKQTVNVPMWAGIGAIVVGGLLLVLGKKG